MKMLSLVLCLAALPLGGCAGPQTAQVAADAGRTVRVPTTLTGTQAGPSTLILGVQ
ncbi:hypothetical protein [uncultured Methylobacterium sp.]|uniref:hypothetical protein n=1 Tax=uncultured Methylobacterium sp. TaxID=157278 RepID=UPI0035C9B96D